MNNICKYCNFDENEPFDLISNGFYWLHHQNMCKGRGKSEWALKVHKMLVKLK